MFQKITKFSLFALLITLLQSCNELKSLANLTTNCEYKVSSVNNYSVAGFDVGNKTSLKDFGFINGAKLTTALLSKSLPIEMNVNVGVKNSGSTSSTVQNLEWQAFVDGKSLANGMINEAINIPANGNGTIPFRVQADLFNVLSGESKDMILNTALTLLTGQNSGNSSKLSFKVRPSYKIGGQVIQHPNFININL